MQELGVAKTVSLKDIFEHESAEFTPWLSSNLDKLASEIGVELETEDTEVNIGTFKVDIQARTTDGRTVVIENQFDKTDHTHLGQLLTYAAGLEAKVVIWIAEKIRDEHRATIDWLNENAADADFFAVEARPIQIDGSLPAILWEVLAAPNDWARAVKRTRASGELRPSHKLRLEYWNALNNLIEETSTPLTKLKPGTDNFQSASIGRTNFELGTTINQQEGWIRVSLELRGPNAKEWFDQLHAQADKIEAELGYELQWDRLDHRKGARAAVVLDADPSDQSDWNKQHRWIVDKRREMESVFRPRAKGLDS
ncbi:MAG: DUF4268 domain-containing protein [Rhodospirillales bacterium]|nr:DUF4268 domain-containing protein [Rhodospirillales bacterium]